MEFGRNCILSVAALIHKMRSVLAYAIVVRGSALNDPISSSEIFPPNSYSESLNTPVTETKSDEQISKLKIFRSPSIADDSKTAVYAREFTTRSYQSSDSASIGLTASALASGLDMKTCSDQLTKLEGKYTEFDNSMDTIQAGVRKAKLKLDRIDVLTHNIEVKQTSFADELSRLQDLYNTLAIRSNALASWMSDEKVIRDYLQKLYREMVTKNNEGESRLEMMASNLKLATKRVVEVEKATSSILETVATAQNAMYGWAVNVTIAVNHHTTKLESLKSALMYRITQIDNVIPETKNVAKRAIAIARSLGETNLAYAASNVLAHVESVMNGAKTTDVLMSIPSSGSSP